MTTNADYFDANVGVPHVQPDGLNRPVYPLACHDVGDIEEPFGDITMRYCPDPQNPGQWKVMHVTQAPPDRVTTEITTPVGKTSDWLDAASGGFPLYIRMSHSADRINYLNYDVIFRLLGSRYTSKTKTNLAAREGTDMAEKTYAVSADPPLTAIYPLQYTLQVTAETQNLLCLASANEPRPQSAAGPAMKACERMFAGAVSAAGPATGNVIRTVDRGNTWAATATDPFAAAENISCAVSFQKGRDVRRLVVGRGVTDAGNPAEVAVSDDNGATWTNYNVGSTNAIFMSWSGSLFAIDNEHIWAGLSNGDMFFSSNGGQTWTEQVTPNTNAIHGIHFASYNYGVFVGASNTLYRTLDGGLHWSAISGPSSKSAVIIRSAAMLDKNRIWLAYDDGDLYYTEDGGASWYNRSLSTAFSGIGRIRFRNDADGAICGYITIGSSYYPAVARTFNGGYDWEVYRHPTAFTANPSTTTEGLNDMLYCDDNSIQAVGNLSGGVATIYTLTP